MSELGDLYRDIKDRRRKFRREFGLPCAGCKVKFPKAQPKILLPGQKCFCGHVDKRTRQSRGSDG